MKFVGNTVPGMIIQHLATLVVLFILTLTSFLCTIVHIKAETDPAAREWRMFMTQTTEKPGGQLRIPPLDIQVPAQVETATFALG